MSEKSDFLLFYSPVNKKSTKEQKLRVEKFIFSSNLSPFLFLTQVLSRLMDSVLALRHPAINRTTCCIQGLLVNY